VGVAIAAQWAADTVVDWGVWAEGGRKY